ncbi:MAG: hypothetical protein K2V38_29295, partial [Gemmataceae bacterium]|nr:hypothetical protein [Gemmataceae bacterium]
MNSNTISPEQRAVHDLFPQVAEILNRHGVEYLAIGGNALRQHAPQKLLIEAVGGEEKAVEGPSGSKMPVVSGGTIRHEINPQKGANDIDFWVKPSRENALRLSLAMEEVQPTDKAAVQLLLQQLAKPECRVPVTHEATGIKIDLLSSVSGEGLIGGYDTARANSVVR